MKRGVLMDTGPLVAYRSSSDAHHDWAVAQFETLTAPLIACEPVVTEACFLLARSRSSSPQWPLEMVARGIVRIGLRIDDEAAPMRALMQRYANVPMSLADACLVRLAEMTGLPICTLDADFAIYRAHGRRPLDLIAPPPRPRQLHEP
jgi:uncharacterized protein